MIMEQAQLMIVIEVIQVTEVTEVTEVIQVIQIIGAISLKLLYPHDRTQNNLLSYN